MRHIFLVSYLLVFSAGYFYKVLDGAYLLTERDLSLFFIPPRMLWVKDVLANEFPLWDPYTYAGHPLFATLQPGVLYPPNVILLILPFDLAFNWSIVLHFFLAGLFTFTLLKELKASYSGSLVGAATFMLSGYLYSTMNVMSTLFSLAWVPLVLFLFIRAQRRGSFPYAVLTGVGLTLMFLGGGIEVMYGSAGLIALLALVPYSLDFGLEAYEYPGIIRRLCLVLAVFVVFVLLSLVQILPFVELASLSTRSEGFSYYAATLWSIDLPELMQFIIHDPFGNLLNEGKYWTNQSWLKSIYLGSVPFVLSLFFLGEKGRKTLSLLFAGLAALSVAMGRNSVVHEYLFRYLPTFNKIRYPVKFLFLVFVLASISAGLGYDSLERGIRENAAWIKRILRPLLFTATVAAVLLLALYYFDADVKAYLAEKGILPPVYNEIDVNVFNTKRLLFIFIAVIGVIYAAYGLAGLRKALPYAVMLLLTIDLFFAHEGYYLYTKAEDYHRKSKVVQFLDSDKGLYRVFTTPKTRDQSVVELPTVSASKKLVSELDLDKEKISGYNAQWGVYDLHGNEVMMKRDFTVISALMSYQKKIDSTNLFALFNVKYVISIPKIDSTEFKLRYMLGLDGYDVDGEHPGLRPVDRGLLKKLIEKKTLKVYENTNLMPRFFLVHDFKVERDAGRFIKKMLDKRFKPGKEALFEADPGIPPLDKALKPDDGRPDSVTVTRYANNSITLKAFSPQPSVLVAGEVYYPGWQAYVDGRPERIIKTDFVLRGLFLPAGEHDVKFVYRPMSFVIGAWVSGLTALCLVAAGAVFIYWKRIRRPPFKQETYDLERP